MRIKEIIKEKKDEGQKILLKDLASDVFKDSSHPYIKLNRILEGKTKSIEIDKIKPIAEFLGVSVGELFGEKPTELTPEAKEYLKMLIFEDARIKSDNSDEDFKKAGIATDILIALFSAKSNELETYTNIVS
jgi:transcriptional regulator with XRE-family HTH domain